jgi:FAD/FMN-containing dehydrogenase
MKNWSGYLTWDPKKILFPESEKEIQNIVKKSFEENQKIRVIGSGHSFTPLCATNDILISLDTYQGLISADKENLTATVKGGTKLFLLNQLLHEKGMAMENLGDIDQQSIAGAISTGTHGTGITFGSLSTQVLRLSFINGL